jgi:hypothetical protein
MPAARQVKVLSFNEVLIFARMTDEPRRRGPEFGLVIGVALGIALGLVVKEVAIGILVGAGLGLLLFANRGRGRRKED